MTIADNPLNLWPGTPPGTCRPDKLEHPAAKEIPWIKPFMLAQDGVRTRPLIIVCPGGGYSGRAAHEGEPVAVWLNGLGLHAVVCHYRVYPWLHPAPLMDAQRAVRLVRANATSWGIDPQRIGVLGFSAGGHLACSVANFGDDGDVANEDPIARASSHVNALISCYSVVTNGLQAHLGSFQNLLGEHPDAALWQSLSLENSVTSANPPAFIWHTANDPVVPVANALLYAQALADVKVPFALQVYPNGPHGIGLARDFPATARLWTTACEVWFRELGW